MSDDTPSPLNNVITIDDERIKSHLDRVVRGTVEETLNALLDASGSAVQCATHERSEARRDSRLDVCWRSFGTLNVPRRPWSCRPRS